jgi:hydroxymethylglutaryl-CoA reductase
MGSLSTLIPTQHADSSPPESSHGSLPLPKTMPWPKKPKEMNVEEKRDFLSALFKIPKSDFTCLDPQKDQFYLPCGFVIKVENGELKIIQAAVEEPSVVAAQNYGAKIINENGGVQSKVVKIEDGFAHIYVKARIHPNSLKRKGYTGEQTRDGIVLTSDFAQDPERAVTHNKGTANGFGPRLQAFGGDVVAAEVMFHFSACSEGKYNPVLTWKSDSEGYLVGEGVIPIPLNFPSPESAQEHVKLAYKLAGTSNPLKLAVLCAEGGIESNLTALAALATEGINAKHLALHDLAKKPTL